MVERNKGTGGAGKRISFYPGCSLTSSAREFSESFLEMARMFELEVVPLEDWNCCGSSPAHSTHHGYALLLAARNLLLAEQQGVDELMVMCPSCFVRLRVRLREAERALRSDEGKNRQVEQVLGKRYGGRVRLRFFLEVLNDLKLPHLEEKVKQSLDGLRGAMYYGCLLTRPEWITGFDVGPYERFLEGVLRSLGAEPVHWGYGRQCCGAHLAVTKAEMVDRMVDRIRDHARRAGANCLVAFCPLCQVNLELRGKEVEPLPVFYIPELIGLAAKLPKCKSWLRKHLVDPNPLLTQLKVKI
jgi:heterodisulfide reductase subunit B